MINILAVYRDAIATLCRLALTNHVRPFLLYLPLLDELTATNVPPVLRVEQEISRQLSVSLVDMTPDLQRAGKALYLDADPVHLNAHGNQLVCERLVEALKPLIAHEQAGHH